MPAPASTEGSTEGVGPASGKRLAEPPPHPTSALKQLKTKGKQNPRSELGNAIRTETVGTAATDMFQADISTCSPTSAAPFLHALLQAARPRSHAPTCKYEGTCAPVRCPAPLR